MYTVFNASNRFSPVVVESGVCNCARMEHKSEFDLWEVVFPPSEEFVLSVS